MYTIATLYELYRHLGLSQTDAEAEADLRQALQKASGMLESRTGRRYCPYFGVRELRVNAQKPGQLILPDDLQQLHAVQREDGSAIAITDLRRLPADPDLPASLLLLEDDAAHGLGLRAGERLRVTGVWGWHDRWTQAWRDSGDSVLDDPLSASATALTVSDADAADRDGAGPRFQAGQLLRIEGEYLRVTAVDATANRLTLLRAAQGTSAAPHASATTIETYAAPPAIRDLCLRYAALMLQSAGPLEESDPPLLSSLRRLRA